GRVRLGGAELGDDGERDDVLLAVAVDGRALHRAGGAAAGDDDDVAVERDLVAPQGDDGLFAVAPDADLVRRALDVDRADGEAELQRQAVARCADRRGGAV